jgi:hypothetical protein
MRNVSRNYLLENSQLIGHIKIVLQLKNSEIFSVSIATIGMDSDLIFNGTGNTFTEGKMSSA